MLSPEEFANVLSKSGFKFEQSVIDKMVAAADVNGDGAIDFGEFVPAMMKLGESMQEELFGNKGEMPDLSELTHEEIKYYLEGMFKIGDANGDGVLSPEEFANVLSKSGFKFEQSVIDKMVAAADVNGDGVIDFGEFVPAMMKLGESMQEELFGNKGKVATQVEARQQQTGPCKHRVRSKYYL